jgi:hypothetical protein
MLLDIRKIAELVVLANYSSAQTPGRVASVNSVTHQARRQ